VSTSQAARLRRPIANLPPSATGGSAHSPGRFGRVANLPPSATGGSAHSPGRFRRVANLPPSATGGSAHFPGSLRADGFRQRSVARI